MKKLGGLTLLPGANCAASSCPSEGCGIRQAHWPPRGRCPDELHQHCLGQGKFSGRSSYAVPLISQISATAVLAQSFQDIKVLGSILVAFFQFPRCKGILIAEQSESESAPRPGAAVMQPARLDSSSSPNRIPTAWGAACRR